MIVARYFTVVSVVLALTAPMLAGCDASDVLGIRTLLFPDDTVYGPGYSEDAFEVVEVGMSRDEVRDLLGAPLEIVEYSSGLFVRRYGVEDGRRRLATESERFTSPPEIDQTEWIYSRPGPEHDNYHVRLVKFGSDGTVASKHASFYSD